MYLSLTVMPSAPWYTHLNLDLILHVLANTLFHPFLAALLPVCLRALAAPYTCTSFILTTTFAASVSAYRLLEIVNRRVAYGVARKVSWANEVVVITGGVGGLGGCLAEIFALRGVGVAVLDVAVGVKESEVTHEFEKEGVRYYRCDVGDSAQVEAIWAKVVDDLGTPTILINNAAVVNAKPLLQQTIDDVEATFRVNTLSHFLLARLFVRGLLHRRDGGAIVTVSSVLGHLGAAQLSAYTASKAALLAYHASIASEFATIAPQIKTVLVATGQLDSALFSDVKLRGWSQRFMGPVVGAGEVAVKIVALLDKGTSGEVRLPAYAAWVAWMGVLPMGAMRVLRRWSGIDEQFGGLPEPAELVEEGVDDVMSSDESWSDGG